MTTTDAARLACCTRQSIWKAIKSGALPAVKVGRDWQIDKADFDKWLAAPRNKGGRPKNEPQDLEAFAKVPRKVGRPKKQA